MPETAVLFDEWHLRWWLPKDISTTELQQLRTLFNTGVFQQQLETTIAAFAQQTSMLSLLNLTIVH